MGRAADAAVERAAERARALRAARTEVLARRGRDRAALAGTRAYLVCACGAERYGLPLEAAAGVLPMRPCTPVPGAVPALVGLAAVSGRIVSVLDLARALGRPTPGAGPGGHLVTLRNAPVPLALAVDRVLGVAEIDLDAPDLDEETSAKPDLPAAAHPSSGGMGDAAVSGYAPAKSEGGDFVVLDLPRLLRRALP
ncbi:chemotaxis protein CheW [Methylobacterium radiodurans]|uniref:chemotaxis protein CheW n=1 Tax=Methylobacterium radiodurans TaxID=2202828 RepID=UPI00194E9ADD